MPVRRHVSVTAASGARKSANSEIPPSKRKLVCVDAALALVADDDLEPRHEEGRLARTLLELFQVERGILREDLRVGPVADPRAGDALRAARPTTRSSEAFSNGRERRVGSRAGEAAGLAAVERHRPGLAPAIDLDVESLRERVDDGCPDTVQAAGCRVRSAAELAAGVQLGEDDLDAAQPRARLDVDGDAARAIAHLDAAVGVQDDLDARAVAAEGLIDGVVDDLPEAVHEPARVGRPDVHAGALADRFEPLQDLEMMGGVLGGHNPQGYPRPPTRRSTDTTRQGPRTRSAKCHSFAAFSKQSRGCI